ncbi:hypothetical protein HPB47_012256 [Ixodes persulcatus]|uniref:Uncharacterized protein n=1 Tax=Ixodes persulcatus TaxID=34615 RepID=A0AC60NU42_IXOPE|nr:hypothetical protein HPB47_012256 [Ixodes persulcatus]
MVVRFPVRRRDGDLRASTREIQTLDRLKHLMVSDKLKQVMPDEVRTYVLQNETSGWLRPKKVVQLPENFHESRRGRKPHGREKASDSAPVRGRDWRPKETAPTTTGGRFVVSVVVRWDISRETVSNHEGKQAKVVTADLAYVPLSLVGEGENTGQQVLILCAITDKLSERLGALLTPEVYEELLQVRSVLKREAVEMQVMENEIDRDFRHAPEEPLGDKVLEFETAENEEKTDADGDDFGDIEVEPAVQTGKGHPKSTRKMDDDDGWPETLLERQKGEDTKEDRKEDAYGEDCGGREVKPVNGRAGADGADAPTGDPVTQGGESGSDGDGGDEGTNLVGDLERKDPGDLGAPVTAALGMQGPSQAEVTKQLRKGWSDRSESAVERCSGSNPASAPGYDADDHGENVDDGERTAKGVLVPPIQASRRKFRLRRGTDSGTAAVSSPKVKPAVHGRATPRKKVESSYSRRGSGDTRYCGNGGPQNVFDGNELDDKTATIRGILRRAEMDLPNQTPLEVEILRRTADISSISYHSTPTRDADASKATDSDDISRSSVSTPEDDDEPDDGTKRLGNTNCCCVQMETVAECVFSREYPAAVHKQQGRQSCVTSHPDFEGLCLNPELDYCLSSAEVVALMYRMSATL